MTGFYRPVRATDATGASAPGVDAIKADFVNQSTGAGTTRDPTLDAHFRLTTVTQYALETIYRMSWAARKLVDMPVDDIWVPGRDWVGDDPSSIEKMIEVEEELDFHMCVSEAMKASRLFGTAFVIMVPEDFETIDQPLDPENPKPEDLSHLMVEDCYTVLPEEWQSLPWEPNYGLPSLYRVSFRMLGWPNRDSASWDAERKKLKDGGYEGSDGKMPDALVHASRVLRFDHVRSPTSSGWWQGSNYSWGYGDSLMLSALSSVLNDETVHRSSSKLVTEASLLYMAIDGFRETLKGVAEPGTATMEDLALEFSKGTSLYGMQFFDREDELGRVNYAFAGLADLMDRYATRLGSIESIPATRFIGKAPDGMNATGDGDMMNYEITLKSLVRRKLHRNMITADRMMAARAGIAEPPQFRWMPLSSVREATQAEVTKQYSEAVKNFVESHGLGDEESRQFMSQLSFFADLPNKFPEDMVPGSDMEAMEIAEKEKSIEKLDKEIKAPIPKPAPPATR